MMESRVDLPEPDGPAIETYSPLRTSSCTPESACVGDALKLQRSIRAEVRTHAGSSACELHVYGDGAILHRWINAHHLAVHNPVVRVDLSGKTDRDVLGLGLGNLELCFKLLRLY